MLYHWYLLFTNVSTGILLLLIVQIVNNGIWRRVLAVASVHFSATLSCSSIQALGVLFNLPSSLSLSAFSAISIYGSPVWCFIHVWFDLTVIYSYHQVQDKFALMTANPTIPNKVSTQIVNTCIPSVMSLLTVNLIYLLTKLLDACLLPDVP